MRKLVSAVLLLFGASTQAALIDRGGGLIYDDVLDITWLQDANYAMTSGYDSDGLMNWFEATAWADALVYYDAARGISHTGWRLPSVTDIGAPGCDWASGSECSDRPDPDSGEMASLFYATLSGIGVTDPDIQPPDFNNPNFGLPDDGPFINLQTDFYYWSGTEVALQPDSAYGFHFLYGDQNDVEYTYDYYGYAWAVADGDIAASVIPLPPAVWLFGSALVGLACSRKLK